MVNIRSVWAIAADDLITLLVCHESSVTLEPLVSVLCGFQTAPPPSILESFRVRSIATLAETDGMPVNRLFRAFSEVLVPVGTA